MIKAREFLPSRLFGKGCIVDNQPVRGNRWSEDADRWAIVPPPPIAQPRSIIGTTVLTLDRQRRDMLNQSQALSADIQRMTEELRQTDASLRSVSGALIEMMNDPALTEDERKLAEAPYEEILKSELVNGLSLDDEVTPKTKSAKIAIVATDNPKLREQAKGKL